MHIAAVLILLGCQAAEADRLIRELDHDDLERREKASEALRKLEVENLEIDRKLEKLAASASGETAKRSEQIRRFRAATRLLPDPARVLERLASADANVRNSAVYMLLRKGGSTAPIVRGLLGDPAVQQPVLQILIAADDPEYIPDIRAVVDNPNLQMAAVQWLVGRGDASVAPTLRAMAARNPGWHLEQLARLRLPEDIPLFRNAMETNAPHYLRMIRNWPEARLQLAREIRSLARDGVMEAILMVDKDARDAAFIGELRRMRLSENPAAIYLLATLGDRDTVPFLLRLVRQRRLHSGIELLGRLGAREGAWLFRRMLGETPPPEPRDRAAYARALGMIGGTEAEDLLLFMAEDANEEVRFDVAASLGALKSQRALPQLIRSLDDVVAFQKPLPLPPDASLLDRFDAKPVGMEWRQVREAALGSIEAIVGEAKKGTLDERAAAWRAWWDSRSSVK